jgi:predicted glycogen debranching enzyme
VTRDLLNTANLNWAYSELFQNYERGQIEKYLPEAIDISTCDGITVHFAETHDNPRLASHSETYARMRTALSALLSLRGAFGFANGVEWYATEKINVHNSPSLNWGAKNNQVDLIRRLNHLLKVHPVFYGETDMKMVQEGNGNHIVVLRRHVASGKTLLVVVNLDDKNQTLASWNPEHTGMLDSDFIDLLSGAAVSVLESDGLHRYLLNPGQVLCLSRDKNDLESMRKLPDRPFRLPRKIERQRLRAKVFEVFTFYHGTRDLGDFYADRAAQKLKADPVSFCRDLNPFSREARVVIWRWPRDLRREVMVPPGHFLMMQAEWAFRAVILDESGLLSSEESIETADGLHFALFKPAESRETLQKCTLKLSIYLPDGKNHSQAPLMLLPKSEHVRIKSTFRRSELLRSNFVFLNTNGRGAMLRIPVCWGKLTSRYDSLLAGNISAEFPEDRRIMFTRCRVWLVFQGYSQDVNTNCLEAFAVEKDTGGNWLYRIPTGQGEHVLLTLSLKMIAGENAVQLTFYRHPAGAAPGRMDDNKTVQLILRNDIENRNFHETTKAYLGPEEHWPQSIKYSQKEFRFTPDSEHHLRIRISEGSFVWEPEWQYMVHRAVDAERGLDPDSDLFSPGYFKALLKGGQQVTLVAEISGKPDFAALNMKPLSQAPARPSAFDDGSLKEPLEILIHALDDFLVHRGELKSVIAGYPWFLDWGRDALIFSRGLIAAQKTGEVRAILKQFGQFEHQGTLPNMIRGNDAANRDTSDAPLWFILACAELIRVENSDDFLDTECAGRSIRQIIISIGQSYMTGTPNGIRTDPASGLVFSPAHFTWMDTDHPAGSPRQGYPIEIQALWYAALGLLARVDRPENQNKWQQLFEKVQSSVMNLFRHRDLEFFSDCLHASSGQPAVEAVADDALRPNQILAITLGAVKDKQICRNILTACEELLVPGAIRSLADRPVKYPVEVVHHGNIINDPHHPYQGKYTGDEDTQRKPAYHNGTAWSWPFPSFCEAWVLTYGEEGRETALSWLASSAYLLEKGCLGHIPEIMDGDVPHTPRGCDAQAWGASELLRVWLGLNKTALFESGSTKASKQNVV